MDVIKSKTQRYYFNVEFINNTGQLQDARYDAQLIYPLLDHPNEYDICINRARIDLAGVPLNIGGQNIPFQQWEVSLGYYDGTNWNYKNSFVPQFNPKIITTNNYYCINQDGAIETVNPLNPYTITSTTSLTNINPDTVAPCFDSAYNTTTFYIMNSDNNTINIYQNNSATLVSSLPVPTDPTYYATLFICTDKNGNIYRGYTNTVPGGNYTPVVQAYTRTSINTWVAGIKYTCSALQRPNLFFETMFVLENQLNQIIAYFNQVASVPASPYVIWTIGTPVGVNAFATNNGYRSITNADYVYRCDNAGNFSIATNLGYVLQINKPIIAFIGFDADGNLLVIQQGATVLEFNAINNLTGVFVYSFTPPNGSLAIGVGQPFTQIVDSGKTDNIYTYQKYLNQINTAFENAFQQMVTTYGASYTPTQAPKVIYNADSKLFQMIVEGAYLQNSKFLIDFNYNLNQLFLFNNYADTNNAGFYLLEVLNNYTNAIVGNGSITTPQFLYVEQQTSTTYQFWNLARIIIATSKMQVNGDSEGTSGNNQILAITDFTPDVSTLSPNSQVIFSPFVLRFYQMYGTSAMTRLDLFLLVGDKAGQVFPLQLQGNGGYASVKLEWRKSENN